MSRVVNAKIRITGELAADVPVSIGGSAGGDPFSNVDMDLARDGRGRYYIPGSSLAGPMRAWVELNLEAGDISGKAIANRLFGDEDGSGEASEASPFFVDDAVLKNVAAEKERRHGIKIEEKTGTVDGKSFYKRAILPKGSSFPVYMELELADDEEKNKIKIHALRLLLEAMRNGHVRFGACKTRGLGAMRIEKLKVDYYDFTGSSGSDALRRWLDGGGAGLNGLEALPMNAGVVCREAQRYRIDITWSPKSNIMVNSGGYGIETDMMPLMSAVPDTGKGKSSVPVIPGSSLKGALRSQAGKIMRTLCGGADCLKIVEDLFGGNENAGRVFIDDVYCLPKEPPARKNWLSEDTNVLDRITVHEAHVAIDRFTGGASDGALYSIRPVKKEIEWSPITLSVNFSYRSEKPDKTSILAELALLWLLVRDLKEGYIPIGFGTHRGLGGLEVKSVAWPPDFPSLSCISEAWKKFQENGYKLRMEAAREDG